MVYEFLKDFHKRIEIVAIVEFITSGVSRKLRLREYGFSNIESMNLAMLVLCFIMERSLMEEICTKNDIASYIRRLDIDYFKKNIKDEDYLVISEFIIKDCLQNSGVPYYFTTCNYETNMEERINVKLIDDKRVVYGSDNTYSYYMTPQGYKFMFNTLEIEESMKVSIEQFKLNISIKKKNFNVARNNVDNLFNMSKTQIQKINYFIKRVKEDIGSTGIDEYEEIYTGTFSSIDEQKEGYDNLYELIRKTEKTIMESLNRRIDKEALSKDMESVIYIKNRLKFIINEQAKLLLKQQESQKIYNEAIDNMLYIGFENRLNFEETVVKKFETDPQLAFSLVKVLRPLFMPGVIKRFNINKALKEQKIANLTFFNEQNNVLVNENYLNRFESERDIRIRDINKKYIAIFEIICRHSMKCGEISISELISNSQEEYDKLVPDIKILMNVLLQLSNIGHIDFVKIKNQKSNTVFNPSEEFDIKYCVLELLDRNEEYEAISSMKILLSRNETVFIPERVLENNDGFSEEKVTGLKSPEILFKVEVI